MKRRIDLPLVRGAFAAMLCMAVARSAVAQLTPPGSGAARGDFPASVSVKLDRESANPGDTVTLDVTVTIDPGFHTYALEQPDEPNVASKITLDSIEPLVAVGDWAESLPQEKFDDILKIRILLHYMSVTWTRELKVPEDAAPGEAKISGKVRFTVCNDQGCLPLRTENFAVTLQIASAAAAETPASPLAQPAGSVVQDPPPTAEPISAEPPVQPEKLNVIRSQTQVTNLAAALGFGFLAGLILNVMPCVLPVIALKIYGFVKQAGEDRRTIRNLGLSFGAGILVVFLILAAVAVIFKKGWGQLFQEEWFVISMIVGLVAFALGMFDVWVIKLPGFVGDAEAAAAQKEGLAASFGKGMLATIISTPCSGPFLGAVLLYALNQSTAVIFVIFTAIGLGMAFPFVLLAWFPGWMKILPKPGEWMKTFKEFMGFMILATAVWLLWQRRSDGEFVVWTIAFCVFVSLALWLHGHWTNPLASTVKRRLAPIMTLLIISGGGYFCYGVMMDRQAPTAPGVATWSSGQAHGWQPFDLDRVMALRAEGKTVVVDWTADW